MRALALLSLMSLALAGCVSPVPLGAAPEAGGADAPAPSKPLAPGASLQGALQVPEDGAEQPLLQAAPGWTQPVKVGKGIEPSLLLVDSETWIAASLTGLLNYQENNRVWRTTDGGATWQYLPPSLAGKLRGTALGGGDVDLALDAAGNLYLTGLWLGSASVAKSKDLGSTWEPGNPLAMVPLVDRQWMVATQEDTVYLTAAQIGSGYWVTKSTDGGLTWTPFPASVHPTRGFLGTKPSGNLAADPNDPGFVVGAMDSSGGLLGQGPAIFFTRDAGATWDQQLAAEDDRVAGSIFHTVSIDAAGNVFLVYGHMEGSDPFDGPRSFYLVVGWQQAQRWSAPIPIALAKGSTHIFPWVAAGAPGEAVVGFYTAYEEKDPSEVDGDWFLRLARVKAQEGQPAQVSVALADASKVYTGDVAVGGTSTDKPLGDFLTARLLPDGKAVLAYNRVEDDVSYVYVVREA